MKMMDDIPLNAETEKEPKRDHIEEELHRWYTQCVPLPVVQYDACITGMQVFISHKISPSFKACLTYFESETHCLH